MTRYLRCLVGALLILAVGACQTTTNPADERLSLAYNTLKNASGLDAPGVQEQLAWLRQPDAPVTNVAWMIYNGSHPDVIMALVEIDGTDQLYSDYYQRLYHDYIFDTPYRYGNAFQLAVSAQRPDLAERIAIHAAKQAGDYREGLPLDAIPSVVALATQGVEPPRAHFSELRDSIWSDFYHDLGTMERINAQPADTYLNPPGRGLLFRYAASMRPGWRYETVRQFGELSDELYERLGSPATIYNYETRMDLADAYEKDLAKWSVNTVQFILRNFGGDVNETLPFCLMRNGEPAIVCPTLSPTHLAARNTTMRDEIHRLEWYWLPAGKMQGFLVAGGNPNQPDSYGITPMAYARTGGVHPGANGTGDDFNITQLFAGAAIIAGSAYMAGEGSYDQATEFFVGGMTDVIDGTPDNLIRMHQEAQQSLQNSQASQSGSSSSGATATAQMTSSQYSFTCPGTGKTHSVPITTASQACRTAMQNYARAAGCNLIDEIPSTEKAYYSACASEIYQ